MSENKRDTKIATMLRKRAEQCRRLAAASTPWMEKARLKGKAEGYDHAAEIVLNEPSEMPAVKA